jgi:hypothetical protein
MLKKAIVFVCPDKHTQVMAATITGAYLKNFAQWKHLNTSFTEIFNTSICRMFGLATSAAYYHDKMDEQLPDFHGFTPRQTFAYVLEKMRVQYPTILGRATSRMIKREDTFRVMLFHETPDDDTVRGLIDALGARHLCMIFIDCKPEDQDYQNSTRIMLQSSMVKRFSMQGEDRDHLRLMCRGITKLFLGIEEDV